MSAVTPTEIAAQQVEMQKAFATVSDFLVKSAEMVPEAKYSHRPAAGVRTLLQLVAHVADGNNYYCALASGRQVEWSDTIEKTVTTKAQAVRALIASIQACEGPYKASGAQAGALIENIAHANLHYGNVIVYLRSLGITPPSS